MLDTHQLNVFLIAAETLNFTEAARLLHMSQPSVSQHIQALEQNFGQALFLRSGRHMQLTDAGLALLPQAREMVNRSVQIEEMMKSLEGEVHGHLLVGCSTTPGKYILPQILADFHRLYPKVKVSCHVSSQDQAFEMVCAGEVHIALVSAPYVACRGVELKQFMTDPIHLIAPLNHPWANRDEIDPAELYGADFIFREDGCGTQLTVNEGLTQVGIVVDDLEPLLVLGNSEAIALAVQEGIGIGFVSSIVVTRLVQGRVAIVKVRGLTLERDIYIGCHNRRAPTIAQHAFWEFINRQVVQSEQAVAHKALISSMVSI